MQCLLFSTIPYGDAHVCNHSVFLSVNLTKGVGEVPVCRFPCFIAVSRADWNRGSGSKLLQDRLRLTIKQSFLAKRIAEPRNRLSGRKIAS